MFQLYSKGCEYAIRALVYVVPGKNFLARVVCKKAGIPESFTRKIFQSLVQSGFLKAVPGPGGGYALTRSANEISILSIIEAVDGTDAFNSCIMGLHQCRDRTPCPLHVAWKAGKKKLMTELKSKTLQDLIKQSQPAKIKKRVKMSNQP